MQRRLALALSLAFTTIVTFAVVTVGAQAGFFSDHPTVNASQVAADVPAQDPSVVDAATAAPAEQDPLIVTDYVYMDETAVPATVHSTSAASPQPATPAPPVQPKLQSSANADPTAVQPSPVTEPTRAPDPTQAAVPTHATEPIHATEPTAPPAQPKPSASPVSAAPRQPESEHERDD
jgi:hypothetical protein